MRKVTLLIAMSLDGYIADLNGGVDWLAGQETDGYDMGSYDEFIKEISTVVMGWNTYHQIVTELFPQKWPYEGLETYVFTHKTLPATADVQFISESPGSFVKELRQMEGKGIWICGGAAVVQQLMAADCIDRYHISIIPTILGHGIPLFQGGGKVLKLKQIKSESYNGITDLIYEPRGTI